MAETVFEIGLSALTDVGVVRSHNEDNFILCPDLSHQEWFLIENTIPLSQAGCLLVVADGMGGANAGEVASEIAVEHIKQFFIALSLQVAPSENQIKEYIKASILQAHQAIVSHAIQNPACEGMGTTIILAWVIPGKAFIGWCGDSRGYLFRPGEGLRIITSDHSLVWELVQAGRLSPEEADVHPDSNIITQSLGDPDHLPEPGLLVQPLQASDKLLLCSDGLNNMVTSSEIAHLLTQSKSLAEINQVLIQAANQKGGKDNITVILLEVIQQTGKDLIGEGRKKTTYGLFLLLGLLCIGLLWWASTPKGNPTKASTLRDTTSAYTLPVIQANKPSNIHSTRSVQSTSETIPKKDKAHKVASEKVATNTMTSDNSLRKVENNKQEATGAIGVDSSSSRTRGGNQDQVDKRIEKVEEIVKDWNELEKRISEERSKLTKHNIDSVANAGGWLLLDQAESEVAQTIKNNKWSEAYWKDELRQQLNRSSFEDVDQQINQLEKTITHISQALDSLIQQP